jgi:transposase
MSNIVTSAAERSCSADRRRDLTRGQLKATRTDVVTRCWARHGPSPIHAPTAPRANRCARARCRSHRSPHREALGPFRAAVSLLTTMPGIRETTARVLVAEIGTDMGHLLSVGHRIPWAGFCPGLDESVGKRRSTRTRQSAPRLRPTLANARAPRRTRTRVSARSIPPHQEPAAIRRPSRSPAPCGPRPKPCSASRPMP